MTEYTVPLAAFKAERKKHKEKIKNLEEKMEELISSQEIVASNQEDIPGNQEETAGMAVEPKSEASLLAEFAELVKNPYYADSAEHIVEIHGYAQTHGVPLKTAYNVLFAEEKYERIRQKAEMEAIEKLRAKQTRKIEAVDSGSGIVKKAVSLNADQLAVAAACGMTAEEYAKWM